jgi:hypothetical protein
MRMSKDNIKIDLKQIGLEDFSWIRLAQNKEQWLLPVTAVINPGVLQKKVSC